jgi:hypothetical protein
MVMGSSSGISPVDCFISIIADSTTVATNPATIPLPITLRFIGPPICFQFLAGDREFHLNLNSSGLPILEALQNARQRGGGFDSGYYRERRHHKYITFFL